MSSLLVFFKYLVHVNLNLALLVLLAWGLLGRGKGIRTSLLVWSLLLARFFLEPFLYRAGGSTGIDFAGPGMLSVGLGLSRNGHTLSVEQTLAGRTVSVSDLAVCFLNREVCLCLAAMGVSLVSASLALRLLALWASPGLGGVVWREGVFSPHVFGWRFPTVILPTALREVLSPEEQRAVLAHERGHVAFGDHRWYALIYLFRAFCWVVWPLKIVLDGLEHTLERRCDRRAAAEVGPVVLARALVKTACWVRPSASPALTGASIKDRLRSLRRKGPAESAWVAVCAVTFLGAVIL